MLCIPVLLLTAGLCWAVNSSWLYEYGFKKYSISQTPEPAELDLEDIASRLISYFNSDEEYVSLLVEKDGKPFELFTREEAIHFRDVKGLVWLDYRVLLGTLIYTLAYAGVSLFWHKRQYWRRLAWGTAGGSSLTLVLMLALGLGILLNFDQIFLQFHLFSFSNEYWSTEGYMLLLFRERFFYDAALFCALTTTAGALILGGVSGRYLYKSKGA